MTTYTEAVHAAEFLAYYQPLFSVEKMTLASGQNLAAGTVVQFVQDSLTNVTVFDGTIDSVGGYDPQAAGILWDAVDASGGAKSCTVVRRHAVVYLSKLTYPAGMQAETVASLLSIGIICR
jgi:hypothetical protein